MAKPIKNNSNKQTSKVKEKTKEAQKVTANQNLVDAIRESKEANENARTKLIAVATIVEEEQCTNAEVIASYMEATGCELSTAKSQASRIMGLVKKPEVLEQLRTGDINLAAARAATVKKQANPSAAKKGENAEKRYNGALTKLIAAAKDLGTDLTSFINSVKAAAKKAGIAA